MTTWARLTIRTGDTLRHKVLPLDVAQDMQAKMIADGTPPHCVRLYWPVDKPS